MSPRARQVPVSERGVDERIWGRRYRGPRPWVVGLLVVLLIAALSYLAYTKSLPFSGPDYQLHATFHNAANLRADSPVRIAGVDVGEVTDVQLNGEAAEVTFTVEDEGQPVHDDARVEIRPRLFLEGNFFLDLKPGSPSGSELPDGATIPVTQTSTAVQLDEILTSLNTDSRKNLQNLLEGFGTGLNYQPTAADDVTQDPDVKGETAGEALNDTFHYGGRAGKNSAITNQALLGTEPHDLSELIAAQRRFFGHLNARQAQLQDLITNFNTFTGALASESANLSETVRLLAPTLESGRPALQHLNASLPSVGAFARDALPGVEELPATIDAGLPWLAQTRALLGRDELGGLTPELRDATPALAKTAHTSLQLFPQVNLLSRCVTDVLDPTGDVVIDDNGGAYPFSTGETNFREFFLGAVNLTGESQLFDGNGSYVRFQSGGGPFLITTTDPDGEPAVGADKLFATTIAAPQGTRPLYTQKRPPFRSDVPCHTNPVPDVNGTGAAGLPGDVGPAAETVVSP